MKKSISVLLVLLGIFFFFSYGVKKNIRNHVQESLSFEKDEKFPNITAHTIQEDSLTLDRIISENRYVWINFWTTWCSPCQRQMPMMSEIYTEFNQDGLAIVAVNVGEDSSTIRDYLSGHPVQFPVLLDGQEDISNRFNIEKLPTSYLVDSTGTIQEVGTGVQRSWEFIISNKLKD